MENKNTEQFTPELQDSEQEQVNLIISNLEEALELTDDKAENPQILDARQQILDALEVLKKDRS